MEKKETVFGKFWHFIVKHKGMAILLVIVLAVAAFFIVRRANSQASAASALQTATIEKGTVIASIGATGTVRSNQMAILSWQTNGTIGSVNFKSGDTVQAGDVLAKLASTSLSQSIILAQADLVTAQRNLTTLTNSQTAMAQAQLALYQAQNTLDNAQTKYDDMLDTYGADSTKYVFLQSKANLNIAKAKLADAQAEWNRLQNGPDPNDIAAAQARVDAAQASLRMAQLAAPFAGTVTEVNGMAGDQVSPGTRGFRIDDLSRMQVDVQVSEVDINGVQAGQDVILTFDAISGGKYHGKVVDVAQAGDVVQGTVNFTVTVELTDADAQVKPGMTAAVTIVVQQLDNVLLVPNRAVRLVNNQRVVYLLRNGQTVEIPITIGASSDTVSQVLSGDMQAGDTIILNPPSTLFTRPSGNGGF